MDTLAAKKRAADTAILIDDEALRLVARYSPAAARSIEILLADLPAALEALEEARGREAALLAALNIGRHYVVYVRDKAAEEGWEKWADVAPDLRTIDDALVLLHSKEGNDEPEQASNRRGQAHRRS